MANKVTRYPVRMHCGQPMSTWRNTRWVNEEKGRRPFRWYACLQCGHQESERLDTQAARRNAGTSGPSTA